MEDKKYSKYFKAFGDPSRLRILSLLAHKEMTVNEIVEKMNISQSTVSRHLSILKDAEIVTDRRQGQTIIYSLNKVNVENCCKNFCIRLNITENE